MTITVNIPMRTRSLANQREHWSARAKRAKQERWNANLFVTHAGAAKQSLPVVVTLTRFAPRQLDSDNLCGAFKAVRDGVADALGIDDGSDLVTWVYAQEKAKEYSVSIRIERKP